MSRHFAVRVRSWLAVGLAVLAVALGRPLAAQDNSSAERPEAGQAADSAPSAKPAKPSKTAKENDYIRILRNEKKKPQALETSIIRFEGRPGTHYEGRIVDLVGVVHIGQKDYYQDLDRRLAGYDAVLYELVAPDGTRIQPEDLQERRSLLASMQTGMKEMLELEYQLEHINYLAENFVHADMSPEEFTEDMASRGDGLWKMAARLMGAGLVTQNASGGDLGVLTAILSGDRTMGLRQSLAKQLITMDLTGLDDAYGENTLIKGRNRKAFRVLEKELAAGKKEIAVFYGAGHMEDMASRLEMDFEMSRSSITWLNAWDLQRK